VQPTQRLSLVPRCGTREHTGLTCGRAYGALSIAGRGSMGATKVEPRFLSITVSVRGRGSGSAHDKPLESNSPSEPVFEGRGQENLRG
jgi:hypothetical protein